MNFLPKIICHGCDGKKFVNYVKLKSTETFTDKTKTRVRKCLICKGRGKIPNGLVPKN